MPTPKSPYTHIEYGAIDALANYWFTRIGLLDAGGSIKPELNLEESADIALLTCLQPHGVVNENTCIDSTFENGFSSGLRVVAILLEEPFDAEMSLRELLTDLVDLIRERQKDVATSKL